MYYYMIYVSHPSTEPFIFEPIPTLTYFMNQSDLCHSRDTILCEPLLDKYIVKALQLRRTLRGFHRDEYHVPSEPIVCEGAATNTPFELTFHLFVVPLAATIKQLCQTQCVMLTSGYY